MTELEKYYNKFSEENRLKTRHGQVEFLVSMNYIHKFIPKDVPKEKIKILDLGAGTGAYSIPLASEGFDVTAVELVKHNLEILRGKHQNVKTWQGNAKDISFLDDNTFDITIMFGPCYHLHGDDEKLLAINEAKRVTKSGGIIFIAYVMNEYSVLSYCFQENRFSKIFSEGGISNDFHILPNETELYDYVRISDIDRLNEKSGLERIKIFSPDGPSDYMRRELNAMDDFTFHKFIEFQTINAERPDLIGAGSHTVDILKNVK